MRSPIQEYLERLHSTYSSLRDGDVASYIPELSNADPEWFGISVATIDGRVYEVGDTRRPFTIQSISKPFTYGLALEDRGVEAVLGKIGVEPTGDAFNSISLDPITGCPLNPMINAGAIASVSMIAGGSEHEREQRLLASYSTYAGRPLTIDEDVYRSELATGHRNRAIGHMLRTFDILREDPDPVLDLYFRQCSILVDCRDLSLMAATLANAGVNPITGERALRPEYVERLLSVMTTCGMYDYSGAWVYSIGMPAKSGVSGGVMVALPGQLGVAVFSPPIDARGNSVRGVAVCKDLSRDAELHFLRVARSARSALRAEYTIADVRSKRLRPESQRETLSTFGNRVVVFELQGDLLFPAIEAVVRQIVDRTDALDIVVLELKRVDVIAEPATRILSELVRSFSERGKHLVVVSTPAHQTTVDLLEQDGDGSMTSFPDLDAALEWCEDQVILERSHEAVACGPVSLMEHGLCRGLETAEVRQLEELLEPRHFEAGDSILRAGETADAIFLLM
ncbi:MAG: glutaminase A, partial [Actinomycetota bacterium]